MDFGKLDGLIPAVVQDAESNEVLMVGFMNEDALEETKRSGFATFFSAVANADTWEAVRLTLLVAGIAVPLNVVFAKNCASS